MMEIQMESAILERMSKAKPVSIPYVITAPPAEGYTLAMAVADEGARVLLICEKSLQPPQYRKFNAKMTVFGERFDTHDGWDKLADVLLGEYDAIVFVAGSERRNGDPDLSGSEEDILSFHLLGRLYAAEKRLVLRSSGAPADAFPAVPLGVHVDGLGLSDAA
jgi:hypothetical protein